MARRKGVRVPRQVWLHARPVRAAADYEISDDGNAVILVEMSYKGLLARIIKAISIVPPPRYRRIVLDRMGTRVWLLCDGHHTVNDIVKKLAKETGLSRRSIELAVYQYISMLVEKGLVALMLPGEEEGGGA